MSSRGRMTFAGWEWLHCHSNLGFHGDGSDGCYGGCDRSGGHCVRQIYLKVYNKEDLISMVNI